MKVVNGFTISSDRSHNHEERRRRDIPIPIKMLKEVSIDEYGYPVADKFYLDTKWGECRILLLGVYCEKHEEWGLSYIKEELIQIFTWLFEDVFESKRYDSHLGSVIHRRAEYEEYFPLVIYSNTVPGIMKVDYYGYTIGDISYTGKGITAPREDLYQGFTF